MEVITMSSKGQFVVPMEIREEMGLEIKDKFVIVHDKDSILLKRINKSESMKSMAKLMDKISDQFAKRGIKESDIKSEISKSRAR